MQMQFDPYLTGVSVSSSSTSPQLLANSGWFSRKTRSVLKSPQTQLDKMPFLSQNFHTKHAPMP